MKHLGNQITLGTFVSTFLYSLLVLKFIRTGGDAFVPHLAVNFALVLTVASLAVLIFFFHSVATQIQAESIIQSVASDFQSSIDRLFPEPESLKSVNENKQTLPSDLKTKPAAICVKKSGHIQAIDYEKLLQLATDENFIIKVNYRAGHYLHKHKSLVSIYGSSKYSLEAVTNEVRESITVGTRSTVTQDIEFPINQIVEIAVRALSPGINDPFTANQCIDALTAGLSTLVARPVSSHFCHDKAGNIRLILNKSTFSGVLDTAFHQIRQNLRSMVSVRIKLLESLAQIAEEAIREEDQKQLLHHGQMIFEASKKADISEPADLKDIAQRYRILQRVLNMKTAPLPIA